MPEEDMNIKLRLASPRKLFTPAVAAIIVLMIVGFTISTYAQAFVMAHLGLSASSVVAQGRIWQLLTYPFVTGNSRTLIFNGILVLFIGGSLERKWHTAAFIIFWLVVSVTCGLLWVAVNLATGNNFVGLGAAALAYGLIGGFALLFRRRRVQVLFWTVKAQYLALFLIAIRIMLGIPQSITWIWVSGAIFGAAAAYVLGRAGEKY
jgi:membrane associated rhomboid family serine protease